MAAKEGFVLYKGMYGAISSMTDEQLGKLFRAIYEWQLSGGEDVSIDDPAADMALKFFINQFNLDNDKYQQTCRGRSEAVRKRWEGEERSEDDTRVKDSIQNYTNDTNVYKPIQNVQDHTNDTDKDKDKDKDIYPPTSSDDDVFPLAGGQPELPSRSPIPYQRVVEMWNATCTSFPRITGLSDKRKNKLRVRLEEMAKIGPPLEVLQRLFDRMQESKFLQGDGRRGWKATFDWLIHNGENWRKVMEGNYERFDDGPSRQPPNRYDILRQQQDEAEREAMDILRKRYEKSN